MWCLSSVQTEQWGVVGLYLVSWLHDDARIIYAIFAVGFCVTVKAVAKPG